MTDQTDDRCEAWADDSVDDESAFPENERVRQSVLVSRLSRLNSRFTTVDSEHAALLRRLSKLRIRLTRLRPR
jgi:hypothetical protein